ncbi:hypothetical protein GCM10020001_090150 [Nonomuraea salmonea]
MIAGIPVAEEDVDGGAFRGVGEGVADQVGEDAVQAVLVAGHPYRIVAQDQLHRTAGVTRPRRVHHVGRDDVQVHLRKVQGALLVQTGEQQQVLHQDAHPLGFPFDAAEDAGHDGIGAGPAVPVQLGVPPDGGERGAQLVRGVGEEAAQALLGAFALVQGLAQAAEHDVQRPAQPARLGARVAVGDPPVQLARRDGGGRAFHAGERAQAEADHGQRHRAQQRQHEDAGRRLDEQEPAYGAAVGLQGERDGGPVAVGQAHDHGPPLGAARHVGHGEGAARRVGEQAGGHVGAVAAAGQPPYDRARPGEHGDPEQGGQLHLAPRPGRRHGIARRRRSLAERRGEPGELGVHARQQRAVEQQHPGRREDRQRRRRQREQRREQPVPQRPRPRTGKGTVRHRVRSFAGEGWGHRYVGIPARHRARSSRVWSRRE